MNMQSFGTLSDVLLSIACWGSVIAMYRLIKLRHQSVRSSAPQNTPAVATEVTSAASVALPDVIFQQAIAHTAGALIICDARQPDYPIVYASPSFERLTGYASAEVLGQSCRFLQGEETRQLGVQEIRQAIEQGLGCKVLLRNYRKSGQAFWNEVTLAPLMNSAGVLTHYVGTQIDVSHHLDTFKALQHSEARYRHLYEETPAMMHSVDHRGRIMSMSHYWLEKLGYEREEVISQPLTAFLTESSKPKVEQILTTLESQKVDRNRYCQFVKKNGDRIDVLLSTMAECPTNPREGSTLGVLVDVTERRQAKEKLRRSEALLRAINNLPPTGIFVMDYHTHETLFINDEFYRIWQLEHLQSAVESKQLNAEQLLTECLSNIDLGRFVAASTDEDFTHGNRIVEDEVPLLDGRTLRRLYGPIQENNVTFASLYIFEDITERKQAVQALAQATEAAEAANLAKSEFLANMSHELRSPLNAILGFAHILQKDNLSPTQTENLDIIHHSGEHLLALINDILDISKIEAGKVTLTYCEFDLYRLIDELQQMFGSAVADKALRLVVWRSPKLPRIIYSDRLKLRQVLINLLSNAVKFTDTGTITLSVGLSDETPLKAGPKASLPDSDYVAANCASGDNTLLAFSVADTGAGIAVTDQAKLFEAFVQTHSALTAQQGTGLGLTISHEYVQLLGGDLSVHSVIGEGSTFEFSIAVKAIDRSTVPADPQTDPKDIVGLAPGQPSHRLLVVDDVALNRKLLAHLLKGVGFEVQEAVNGEDAIAQWQAWRPHLIWMDIRMPVMSGEEAALRIKSLDRDRTTRIVALTANAFDDDRTAALTSGCDDFVSKPIRPNIIFDKVAQHLGVQYQYAIAPHKPADAARSDNARSDNAVSVRTSRPVVQPLSAELLSDTESAWRYELTQAVLDLDDEHILELAAQLPATHQTLQNAIVRQVETLGYKKLLQTLQEADTQEADTVSP
ncbi:MAG: PAS domain S-box protein [Cyanobacteria bacterium J06621_11]